MKAYFSLLTLLLTLNLQSQLVTVGPVYVPFVDLPEKISQIKRSSVSIEKYNLEKKTITIVGSGFIVLKHGKVYAVTNYHVIENVGREDSILVGINLEMRKQHSFIGKRIIDEKFDIAVLELNKLFSFNNTIIDSTLTRASSIGVSLFEIDDSITEGIGTIIVGYPLGLGSEITGNNPVSRIGIVAQGVNPETNCFILDCTASHGNSGSPVFNEKNLKLLGMVTAFKPDNINLYDDNNILRAKLPYNSGLTICVTASVINKLIP